MKPSSSAAVLAALVLASMPAWSGGYAEGPDLSNNRLAPTPVALDPGSNVVFGTMGYTLGVLDRDFFAVTVPAGTELRALVLGTRSEVGGGGSFLGFQAGPVLTVDPDTIGNGSELLGWHLYTSAERGSDILPALGSGPDKIGFSGPLPAGVYTFWIQELAPAFPGEPYPPFPFELDFQVAVVPEPASAATLLLGCWWLGRRQMRSRLTLEGR